MLPSIQPPVAPLPTETPGLLQIAWTVRFAVLKGLGNPSAKAKTAFSQTLLPLPGAWTQLSSSIQQTGVARAGSRLLCRQKQRRGETMARFPGHRKGRSAVSREERTVSVVGGCSDSSFIPAAAQSWSLQCSKD